MSVGVKLVREGIAGVRLNSALRDRSALMVTVHVMPEQSPLHPENAEPAAGVAVSATDMGLPYAPSQVAPQLMPAGVDVIVPEPSPVFMTFKFAAPAGTVNKKDNRSAGSISVDIGAPGRQFRANKPDCSHTIHPPLITSTRQRPSTQSTR